MQYTHIYICISPNTTQEAEVAGDDADMTSSSSARLGSNEDEAKAGKDAIDDALTMRTVSGFSLGAVVRGKVVATLDAAGAGGAIGPCLVVEIKRRGEGEAEEGEGEGVKALLPFTHLSDRGLDSTAASQLAASFPVGTTGE